MLTFAERMFETMLDCVVVMRYHESNGDKAYKYIKFMATICVRLLTLYSEIGFPNGKKANFAQDVDNLESSYDFCVINFEKFDKVSFSLRRHFEKYAESVKSSLTMLKRSVSE